MAALTQSSKAGPNAKSPTPNVLTASDTLTYQQGSGQELYFFNNTAGALTVTITGSAAINGAAVIGGGTINRNAGYNMGGAIPAGQMRYLRLDDIPDYLLGNVTLTGAAGLTCLLMGP